MNQIKIKNSMERYPDVPQDMVEKIYRMADNLNMNADEIHQFLSFMQKVEYEDKMTTHRHPISPPNKN